MTKYDTIIVGGGSAGCTIASRLTEESGHNVLLLEAGPDYSESEMPDDLVRSTNLTEDHDWGYESEELAGGRRAPLPRAQVLGGCSASNATYAVRGHRSNYERWAEALGGDWTVDRMMAAFNRLEHDLDFQGDGHGSGGPLPIRRYGPREMTPLQKAFREATIELGHEQVEDHNDGDAIGNGPAPMTSINRVRQSVARRYVWPHRDRPNLTVRSDSAADRVLFDGSRATGVVLVDGTELEADRVVLSAGAYGTPEILMRSGVGAAELLADLGIDVVVDNPNVGANLREHPLAVVVFAAPASALDDALWGSPEETPAFQQLLTLRSSRHVGPGYDLHIVPQTVMPSPDSPTGAVYVYLCSVVLPDSVGQVAIRSADPNTRAEITTGFLTEVGDAERLAECLDVARQLAQSSALNDFGEMELLPGADVSDLNALADYARKNVVTYYHPVGTCRMGKGDDAVVDLTGRVKGTESLFVFDASIMPDIPGINTNLPTIMLAECGAEILASGGT